MQSMYKVVKALCQDTDTPRALTVFLLLKHREYEQLFQLECSPRHYVDADEYFKDVVVTDFLRKVDYNLPGLDHTAQARKQFFECEARNKRTNDRLSRFLHGGPFEDPHDGRIHRFIAGMREDARRILGAIPDDPRFTCAFGPGATFDDKGRYITIPDKITSRPTVTTGARCLIPLWEKTAWGRSVVAERRDSDPRIVPGNRFTVVPKTALKKRGICIEPSMNVAFQLPVGKLLRRRLLTGVGIDLIVGQQIHRDMARRSSLTEECATIDLSNASDTVSYNLVKALLPGNWFGLLDSLRSPKTLIGDKWCRLEKFSSMGNGYTFELETLVFSLICREVARERGVDLLYGFNFGVYGDDIIVPREIAKDVVAALQYFGMEPNWNKTFLEGPFRESCGGDFFSGVEVRPLHLKEIPDEPSKFIALANGFRRLARRQSAHPAVSVRFGRARLCALGFLPGHIRAIRGPESFGDTVIHDDGGWNLRFENGGQRGYIRILVPSVPYVALHHFVGSVQLASALYGVSSRGVPQRGVISGYRKKWVPCLEREPSST